METHESRLQQRIQLANELTAEAKTLANVADTFEVADAILEQLPLCVAVGDSKGWRFVSRRFSDVLGYDRDALSETPFDKIIHPDDVEDTKEMAKMVERGEVAWGEVENRYRVRGTERYVLLRWRWGPPRGPQKLSVAVAEVLDENAR